MVSHGLDPQAVRNVAVVRAGRQVYIDAEVLVPQPDSTWTVGRRPVDLFTPPPVPWTA